MYLSWLFVTRTQNNRELKYYREDQLFPQRKRQGPSSKQYQVDLFNAKLFPEEVLMGKRNPGVPVRFLRKIHRIFWLKTISNRDLLARCQQEDMETIITRRRWCWIGHVLRKDANSITKVAIHWTPEGKRGSVVDRRPPGEELWQRK